MVEIRCKMKKILTKEVKLYIIFGILTTLINFSSFYMMIEIGNIEKNTANFISIIIAILFAYATNRKLVFQSKAETGKEKINEFIKFIGGRTFTMIIEWVGGFLMFQIPIPEMVSKIIITIIVIILNFLISKFFAFRK